MEDMNQVIEDAVNDAQAPDVEVDSTPDVEASSDVSADDSSSEAPVADEPMTKEEREAAASKPDPIVKSPLTDAPKVNDPEDEFAKKFGLASKSVTGRENRIPYSRVKKIIEKNEKDVVARVTKEIESKYQPQLTEFETKFKSQEAQAQQFAEFERILEKEPRTFLERLSQHPAYKPFFDHYNQLASGQPPTDQTTATAPASTDDPRPLPNKQLPDGSKVYDLEGLDRLMEWQARQVEKKVASQLEERVAKRYEPIENEWKQREYKAKMAPIIDKQIAEARTWPLFVENEPEIIKALQEDANLTLDGAWRKVAVPKMVTDRTKMRTEVLAELKKAPAATSAGGGKTAPVAKAGPRSLEDIIAAEIAKVSGGS